MSIKPAGIQAERIYDLWNLTLGICTFVFVAVLAALVVALWKASRRIELAQEPEIDGATQNARHRVATRWVMAATICSTVGLVFLVAVDVLTDHALSRLPVANALQIELVGYQWWWEARYPTSDGNSSFRVSSDLHVPVGRPVVVSLKSPDVIHTFWVPSLHGKKDMLPGRPTTIEFRADQLGVFRGQCAEFCGAEHALMAFGVTADTPEDFARWQAHQQMPADDASTAVSRGKDLFLSNNCAGCHTVRGTPAAGTLGPDLTHLASRPFIAAGTVPNNASNIFSWIYNPQGHKPQSTMPSSTLSPQDLHAIADYLVTLK